MQGEGYHQVSKSVCMCTLWLHGTGITGKAYIDPYTRRLHMVLFLFKSCTFRSAPHYHSSTSQQQKKQLFGPDRFPILIHICCQLSTATWPPCVSGNLWCLISHRKNTCQPVVLRSQRKTWMAKTRVLTLGCLASIAHDTWIRCLEMLVCAPAGHSNTECS
jgi:hypothetical protein